MTLLQMWLKTALVSVSVAEPSTPQNVAVSHTENNVIKVKCDHPKYFHGSENKVIARLLKSNTVINSGTADLRKKKCQFEFRDLDYLTAYTVKVCIILCLTTKLLYVFSFLMSNLSLQVSSDNGVFESEPVTKKISTSCMWTKHTQPYIPNS